VTRAGSCGSGSSSDPGGVCTVPPSYTCGPAKCKTDATDCDYLNCSNCQPGAGCVGGCCWPIGKQCDWSDGNMGSCCGAASCHIVGSGTVGTCCVQAGQQIDLALCATYCCSGQCTSGGVCL
jgi:hypothetical protein